MLLHLRLPLLSMQQVLPGSRLTLAQDIITAGETIFGNTNDFAEEITRYPKGLSLGQEVITANVFFDAAEGTREVDGDGRVIHNERTSIRTSVTLEVLASQAINEPKGTGQEADRFEIPKTSGKIYAVKRILGSDKGLKSVLIVRVDKKTTREPRRVG